MDHMTNIEQITLALKMNLESLDMLGLATAAAYVESAINVLQSRSHNRITNEVNVPFISLNKYSSVDFSELDQIVIDYLSN